MNNITKYITVALSASAMTLTTQGAVAENDVDITEYFNDIEIPYSSEPVYKTGQALGNAIASKLTLTDMEITAMKEGFDTGLSEIEVPDDIEVMLFTTKTFLDERSNKEVVYELNLRSETTITSDRIKAKILGYVMGVSFIQEIDLDIMEAAKLSLGFENQISGIVLDYDPENNQPVTEFILSRTVDQDLGSTQLVVTKKLLTHLEKESKTNRS